MDKKTTMLRLRTKVLLTFENNKNASKNHLVPDSGDSTTVMFPTGTGFPMSVVTNALKKN